MTTIPEFVSNAPKITNEIQNDMFKRYFEKYLFYRKTNAKIKYHCTACRKSWEISRNAGYPEINLPEYRLSGISHKEIGNCPFCGVEVIARSAGMSVYQLDERHNTAVINVLDNKIYITVGSISNSYQNANDISVMAVPPRWTSSYIWLLEPGKVSAAQNFYYGGWGIARDLNYKEPYAGSTESYKFYNPEVLENSFLKYCLPNLNKVELKNSLYNGYCPIKYLQYYATYPSIEMLLKLGFNDIAKSIIDNNNQCKRVINLSGKTPAEVFRCTKQEFALIKQYNQETKYRYFDPEYLKCWHAFKKAKPGSTMQEAFDLYEQVCGAWHRIIKLMQITNLSPQSIKNYISKQKTNLQGYKSKLILYDDYIKECVQLNLDITKTVISKPKDLREAHAETSAQCKYVTAEENKKALIERTKKLKKSYAFEDDTFIIKIPETFEEIIYEGEFQQHCVASYAERHCKGITTILFMRHKNSPEKPLYTIEINGDELKQIRGYKNSSITLEASKFKDKWLKDIKTRKKKSPAKAKAEHKGVA